MAPTRLADAARITAWVGVNTLVATTVAIELAVSWNPLMYSKTKATKSSRRTTDRVMPAYSGILQHDVINHVACVPATVDGLFQYLEQVFAQNQHDRIFFVVEQVAV